MTTTPIKSAIATLAFVASAAFMTQDAEAATVTVTATGTVSSGYDHTGTFGAANTDLTGQNFVAHYVFDTSLGSQYNDGSIYNYFYGGAWYGNTSPLTALNLTIGGVTQSIAALSYGFVGNFDYHSNGWGGGFNFVSEGYENNYDAQTGVSTYSYVSVGAVDYSGAPHVLDPTQPQTFTSANSTPWGSFFLYNYDHNTGAYQRYAYGSFNVASLSTGSGVPAPVPVPAAGVLMLGGLGALGLARRRRAA